MSDHNNDLGKSLISVFSAAVETTIKTSGLLLKAADITARDTIKLGQKAIDIFDENKDDLASNGKEALIQGKTFLSSSLNSSVESANDLLAEMTYSSDDIKALQKDIGKQGEHYRRICNRHTGLDTLMIGGETLAYMMETETIPQGIVDAYRFAYPTMSETVSFEDKVLELDTEQIQGFVAGVKGKLFEMQYIDYLNSGQLPEGYIASLADSATQTGWDISFSGPDGNTVDVLQAKATDSISYVKEAIEKNPNIDIVTTDEVYSQLLLSGASDNVINSQIENVDLEEALDDAISMSEISMNFTPPIFSLALIAFTSYSEKNLTLYEKSKSAGERSGKTYLSYLVGGGVAVLTNTWWLGLIGTVASRHFSDSGAKKSVTVKQLRLMKIKNDELIKRVLRARFKEAIRNASIAKKGDPLSNLEKILVWQKVKEEYVP